MLSENTNYFNFVLPHKQVVQSMLPWQRVSTSFRDKNN